jgi:hypothetical protein
MWKVSGIAVARNEDDRWKLVATAGKTGNRDAVWQLGADSAGWSLLGEAPGGDPNDLWSKEQAGSDNAWQPWRPRAGMIAEEPLGSGQIEELTLAVLPRSDAEVVVLFIRVLDEVHLHRLFSGTPTGWTHEAMALRLPPGTSRTQDRKGRRSPDPS